MDEVTPAVVIRRVDGMDASLIERLAALLVAVVERGASVGFLPPLALDDARAYWRGLDRERTVLLVAEAGGTLVGTVQLQLAAKRNAPHRAEVAKLMVHPGHQRRGIGRALMVALEARAAALGRTLLVLDTREGDPSNDLYRAMGYVEAGRIPGYARSAAGDLHATLFYFKQLDVDG